ncbi:MAG: polyhydroxybutyrate depolymerase [Pseudomonadota bacterium]
MPAFALFVIVALVALPSLALACGGTDRACAVQGGTYHALLPETAEGAPLVVFLHGAGGSGARSAANASFVAGFTARGVALALPSGEPFAIGGGGGDWGVRDGIVSPRDDVVFLTRVIEDAVNRFGLDPDRVLIAGFSRGGSMAWDFACAAPDRIAGLAAVAGGFWEPMVTTCAAPVHLIHTHGFADRTVPLEGRQGVFRGVDFHQGNILKGLDVWRDVNGCPGAAAVSTEAALWRKTWQDCRAGSITLLLGPGGHGIPQGWTAAVLDWFEALPPKP